MKKFILCIGLALSTFCAIGEETRYVTDSFSITMRTGQGTEHKIIKSLRTGTKLKVLEKSDNGYSKVRMENGTEGWVLTRYLIEQPVAKSRLIRAKKQNEQLTKKLNELKENLNSATKSSTSFETTSSKLGKENGRLLKELNHIKKIAANQIALNKENKNLKEEVLSLKREIQTVDQENMTLRDKSASTWFIAGAIVCVIGIFLGVFLPNLRFRRKQSWTSL